mgnify:CR=1 FL=1
MGPQCCDAPQGKEALVDHIEECALCHKYYCKSEKCDTCKEIKELGSEGFEVQFKSKFYRDAYEQKTKE